MGGEGKLEIGARQTFKIYKVICIYILISCLAAENKIFAGLIISCDLREPTVGRRMHTI